MGTRSKNSYYQSEDLSRAMGNVGKLMGFSGNADSNYLTNLGKVSRYEGTEMDNREKDSIWQSLQAILPGMSGEDAFTANLGLRNMGHNREKARTEQQLRTDLKRKGAGEANLAMGKAGVQDVIKKLAEQIESHEAPSIDDYETGPGGEFKGGTEYESVLSGAANNFENLVRKFQAIDGTGNAQKTGRQQEELAKSKVEKEKSFTSYNEARKDAVKRLSAANVTKIEQETTNLLDKNGLMKSLNKDRRMEIRNRVLNNIAKLDQTILTEKDKRELLQANIAVEIEKELTQEEKTETQWFKTATQEETLKTQEQKTAKAESLAGMSAQELEKLPDKLKDEATKRAKELSKLDKDILKLEQQTSTSATQEKLANARRMRVNVQKRVDRILGDARKILIDTQAGNWGTRTYNMLKYPNKNIKKGSTTGTTTGTTTPADSSGLIPMDGGAFADLESETPNVVMPGLQGAESILKALGIGGGGSTAPVTRSANAPATSPAQIAPQILSSLQGQNTAGWNANQDKAFIQKVVAQSNGAVTPEQAMQILEMSKKGN